MVLLSVTNFLCIEKQVTSPAVCEFKNSMARITVLMPAYNVGKYIAPAINSILQQTFADFELLILDDGSTDTTAEVISGFNDNRIRYVRNDRNLGLAENLNKGIELSQTDYIARMDGDDISEPTCLEKQIDYLENHPDVGICGVGFQFFGTKTSKVIYPASQEAIKVQMLFGCAVILPMFRKSVFIENGLRYKPTAFPAEDYRMWAECLRVTKIYNLPEILFRYRMHSEQISTDKRIAQIQKSNEVRLYMLDWLSKDFNEEEKQYFLNTFVPGIIRSKTDYRELFAFASTLEEQNSRYGNFDATSLHGRLQNHLQLAMYSFVLQHYFNKGYNPGAYCRYLVGSSVFRIPFRLNFKILARSILFRKR